MASNVIKSTLLAILLLGLLALSFYCGLWFGKNWSAEENVTQQPQTQSNRIDLHLPGEVEKRIVTVDEIKIALNEASEFSTYTGQYFVTKEAEYTRFLLDNIAIPGTTNTVHIECNGIVKVGYDMKNVGIRVNNDSRIIYISLPDAVVLDNYLIWDTVIVNEKNNILNPIDFAQYQTLISEIESDGLKQATEQGIFENAEKNMKKLVSSILSGFEYEIDYL